jgi:hypothetical protein
MKRVGLAGLSALALMLAAVPVGARDPQSWDGLQHVKAKNVDAVYLQPGADFRGYTKVMLDPTEVAFRKNWQRDQNDSTIGLDRDITDADARRILDAARDGFEKLFVKAYTDAGYPVVKAPGPDVLRVRTAVVNIDIRAPDTMSAGMVRTYSRDAGEATLVIEARDSLTGALLGRAVDADTVGDFGPYIRNRATNEGAFDDTFSRWASISVKGLAKLKALSPIDTAGNLAKH